MQASPKKKQKLKIGSQARESKPLKMTQDTEGIEYSADEVEAQSPPDDSDTETEGMKRQADRV